MPKDTNAKKSSGRPPKYKGELVHLHFVVPVKIRSYLEAAAYNKSTPRHTVSLTECFCDLVHQDMLKHQDIFSDDEKCISRDEVLRFIDEKIKEYAE